MPKIGVTARAIYNPEVVGFLERLGFKVERLRRASRVEPTPDLPEATRQQLAAQGRLDGAPLEQSWWADLTPVNGPILGPFPNNTLALAAEVQYLEAHGYPVAGEGEQT